MVVSCSHCSLPVPPGLIDSSAAEQFCCGGCRLAWQVIHDHGLDRYYELRQRLDSEPAPATASNRRFEEFDDPTFHSLYCRGTGSGLLRVELYLEGVHCAACVWLVERTAVIVDGAAELRLDLGRSLATVVWDPGRSRLSTIARSLDSLGYTPHPFHGVDERAMERREDRALLIRLAVAGAVAGNVMLLAFALYGGHFHGISDELQLLFRWVSLGLSLPAVLWSGAVFHRGALAALRARRLHMDVPVSLGILAGFTWGVHNTVTGSGEIYFDSVTVLIFLLLVGRWVQRRQQRRAARATELLFSLTPRRVRLVEGEAVREVPIEAVGAGAELEVLSGDTIPADGTVVSGWSSLDLALLSGESRPVEVAPGDPVHAGTVNLSAALRIRVHRTGADTRVGRLLELVQESVARKAPVALLADQISGWFVAAVLALAALTLAIWWDVDPRLAVDHAIALLIVSCPCALGLATPLAVAAAVGRAARAGILIKGGDALEGLARPGLVLLDKTGTLTEGRLRLVEWVGDEALRRPTAALEADSTHPVGRALAAASSAPLPAVDEIRHYPGHGVGGRYEGRTLIVGSPAFVARQARLPDELAAAAEALAARGLTPVLIAADGLVRATAGLGDPLRSDAARSVAEILRLGWKVELLSGDHQKVVHSVCAAVGLPDSAGSGGADPEAKVDTVRRAAAGDPVVMVGDGINDAAALAAATVGIGVHGGAEAALAAADVYLSRPGLAPVVDTLRGARRTVGVIRRNLVISLLYNVVAVSLAITGHMHPLVAAVLMPLSSMTVVLSSYRARSFDPPRSADGGAEA